MKFLHKNTYKKVIKPEKGKRVIIEDNLDVCESQNLKCIYCLGNKIIMEKNGQVHTCYNCMGSGVQK